MVKLRASTLIETIVMSVIIIMVLGMAYLFISNLLFTHNRGALVQLEAKLVSNQVSCKEVKLTAPNLDGTCVIQEIEQGKLCECTIVNSKGKLLFKQRKFCNEN